MASRKPTKIFKIKDYPLFLPKGMQYIALVGKTNGQGGALAAQFSGRAKGATVQGLETRESGHARRDTVERSGKIFTRREITEDWTGGGRQAEAPDVPE